MRKVFNNEYEAAEYAKAHNTTYYRESLESVGLDNRSPDYYVEESDYDEPRPPAKGKVTSSLCLDYGF